MKSVKCRISEVSLKKDDLLFINIAADQQFDVNDFIELKTAAEQIGQGKRFYNLINVGEYTLPDREARELSCSSKGSIYKLADAFVIKSLSQKILGNFMLKVNRPRVPTKLFSSIKDAENWINSLRKLHTVTA